ncbi:MAG: hypothetical protein HY892_15745 [Deltaproteobacteria bacterium]|nr:hypothetical protein [Deltaproteobacteria bacterium]
MLEIRLIMNSTVEDIFAFKTCCGLKMFDQNLEIHLVNQGPRPVVVPSCFDLETPEGCRRFNNLMPPGDLRIEPGEIRAFYCCMDETLWNKAEKVIFFDREGNRYPVVIHGGGD